MLEYRLQSRIRDPYVRFNEREITLAVISLLYSMGYGSSKREKMSIKSKNVDIEKGMLYNSTYFYGKPLSGGVALIIESYWWCDGSILNQCEWACEMKVKK